MDAPTVKNLLFWGLLRTFMDMSGGSDGAQKRTWGVSSGNRRFPPFLSRLVYCWCTDLVYEFQALYLFICQPPVDSSRAVGDDLFGYLKSTIRVHDKPVCLRDLEGIVEVDLLRSDCLRFSGSNGIN